MGIFNEQSASTSDVISSGVRGPPGPKGETGSQGPAGNGYKLDANNDYDIENKKLVNVKQGANDNDVVIKSQIQLLDSASPGTVVYDKAVIYSDTGSVHAQNLYLKDAPEDGISNELRILTPHQSNNNIHLEIPDLKNYDGFGGRRKSEMMVTSVDQTVTGKKTFQNIEVPTPTSYIQASNKYYVDYNFLNRLNGGIILGTVSMNRNDLIGIPDNPKFGYSAVNKNYVDGEIAKIQSSGGNPSVDTSQFVLKSGSTMTVDLNMNNHFITNIKDPVNADHGVNKGYVDTEIGKIQNVDTSSYLKIDCTRAMTGDLDMDSNKITNLKTPTGDTDAANKSYIDETLSESHLIASSKKNEFTYLDNPDDTSSEYNITVNGFTDFNSSPYRNKKAYSITLQKDSGSNNYRSRIGFNLYALRLGTYTMIFEFLPPEITNIQLSCQATSAYIHKQVQRDFSNYSKMLVQINNNSKNTPDYIYLTMHGTASASPVNAHLIVYGIKDWSDNVTPEIYDHQIFEEMFNYDYGDMKTNTDIDMNNSKITNINNGTDANDVVNKSQLDSVSYYTNNHTYRTIFGYDFYDLVETSRFTLSSTASGVVIQGVKPGLFVGTGRLISKYDIAKGIKMNNGYINLKNDINQNSDYTMLISLFFT